jgi:SAM-dependent methyltransferase
MQLEDYWKRWHTKPALREVYFDLHRRMMAVSVEGPALEIGGGIGNLASGDNSLIRIDIQASLGVDIAADAHQLPFLDNTFATIYLFDVLHHLQCPLLFFAEASRVLRPGGRLVMVEPGITPLSRLLYGIGHEESVDLGWSPVTNCVPDPAKDPYASNQAIPTVLFKRAPQWLAASGMPLRILDVRWLSLFAYPLTGGFKSWSLIPVNWVAPLLRVEDFLLPLLGSVMGFRLLIAMEKE